MGKTTVPSNDVARLAEVSQSAVSRTFSDGGRVSADMRARVLQAAAQLGYRPNVLARAVISGRSRLIAILVAYLDNHFYPLVLEHLCRAFQDQGYQVQGIVMAQASMSSRLARECTRTGTPVVLLNRCVPSFSASSVTSDNIEGGRQLAHFLADSGHPRVAFISGQEDNSTSRDRESGFYKGLAERGMTVWHRAVGGYTTDGAGAATREIFAEAGGADAIFVANDHMAFTVMDVLRRDLGLRIPEDVLEAGWAGYNLTNVSQPAAAMVEATVAIMLEQVGNAAQRVVDPGFGAPTLAHPGERSFASRRRHRHPFATEYAGHLSGSSSRGSALHGGDRNPSPAS